MPPYPRGRISWSLGASASRNSSVSGSASPGAGIGSRSPVSWVGEEGVAAPHLGQRVSLGLSGALQARQRRSEDIRATEPTPWARGGKQEGGRERRRQPADCATSII